MNVEPIGWVSSPRTEPVDDDWAPIVATITLDHTLFGAGALSGLEDFSHIEAVYIFDRVDPADVQTSARHPRNNPAWPRVGIFAQRAKARPNRIGVSTCRLLALDELTLTVQGLDAIDGTPVLDIKPYMIEFAPRGDLLQPRWADELMSNYWNHPDLRGV
jgi:tRNA-Thr(GGU) m(6)t(6)A37 methyltransferase TsaA